MTNLIPRVRVAAYVTAFRTMLAVSAVLSAVLAGRPAAARPLVSAEDWAGLWRGTYYCRQGVTGLFLTVRSSQTGDVTAVARFFAIPENPSVPTGEVEMAGRPAAPPQINHLNLSPRGWITSPPPRYVLVGLAGDYDEATGDFSGSVLGPGCTRFILRRDLVS
jgi:hypothetical protein